MSTAMTASPKTAEQRAASPAICTCREYGPCNFHENFLGVDVTNSRFGEVAVRTCRECGQSWLSYQVAYEGISASERWYVGPVTPELAVVATPENATVILEGLPWYLFGGSYFGSSVHRGHGPTSVD